MGEILDRVDRAVDAEYILMQRCLHACIDMVRPFMPISADGPDPLPLDNPGFYRFVDSMYQHVRDEVDLADSDDLIKEYQEEEKSKLALDKGGRKIELTAEVELKPE